MWVKKRKWPDSTLFENYILIDPEKSWKEGIYTQTISYRILNMECVPRKLYRMQRAHHLANLPNFRIILFTSSLGFTDSRVNSLTLIMGGCSNSRRTCWINRSDGCICFRKLRHLPLIGWQMPFLYSNAWPPRDCPWLVHFYRFLAFLLGQFCF